MNYLLTNLSFIFMKKRVLFFTAAAAVIVSSSCSEASRDVMPFNEQDAIGFRVLTEKTRVLPMDGNNIKDFSVSASAESVNLQLSATESGFNYFNEINVVKGIGGSVWDYAPHKYFDGKTSRVNFFAWSPSGSRNIAAVAGATDINTAIGDPTLFGTDAYIEYSVPSNESGAVLKQEDLLLAAALNWTGANPQVALTFRHALSMLTFSVLNRYPADIIFVIDRIELASIDNSGKVLFSDAAGNTGTTTWTTSGKKTESVFVNIPPAGISYRGQGSTGNSYISLTTPQEGVVVMPQETGKNSAAPVTTLKVWYHVSDGAGNAIVTGKTATFAEYFFPNDFKLEIGKKYDIKMAVVGNIPELVQIDFTVSVADWTDTDVVAE
jgi:hypothetical protein